jgi:glycosyltransferase involved in cell wall biosynthesis
MKGFEDLIAAFARVRRARPCRLVILGEGSEREGLEREAAARRLTADVTLPGFVANPYTYFARAAAFALTSRYEVFPLALLEAMACGSPVVAARCRWGPEEILAGGQFGLLYDPHDVETLATKLLDLLTDEAGTATRTRAARARVQDFTEDRLLPRLETAYVSACRGRAA